MSTDTASVRQISAQELKAMIEAGVPFEFVDVRTEWERDIATIEGARQLDQAYHDHLLTLPRETAIVFQCHHGIRSESAARYFVGHGFQEVYNLRGGIDAWSKEVDPAVPLY